MYKFFLWYILFFIFYEFGFCGYGGCGVDLWLLCFWEVENVGLLLIILCFLFGYGLRVGFLCFEVFVGLGWFRNCEVVVFFCLFLSFGMCLVGELCWLLVIFKMWVVDCVGVILFLYCYEFVDIWFNFFFIIL